MNLPTKKNYYSYSRVQFPEWSGISNNVDRQKKTL